MGFPAEPSYDKAPSDFIDSDPDPSPRARRNHRSLRVLERFFEPYRVHRDVLHALSGICHLHSENLEDIVLSGRGDSRCVFLFRGYAVTHPVRRTSRLWKGTSFFGTSSVWKEGTIDLDDPLVVARGAVTALTVPGKMLQKVLFHEPTLAAALLRMTFEQQRITEDVYGATNDVPVVRVAGLLDYLAVDRPVIARSDDGRAVVTSRFTKEVNGPTQGDIADALGMGRATVEKALAALRKEGALKATPPGQRKNRYYEIADEEKLKLISMGALL